MVALPGAGAQQWHRDDERLFPGWSPAAANATAGEAAEANGEANGAVPPYALNVFMALTDVSSPAAGATEFIMGSHQWVDTWAPHAAAAAARVRDTGGRYIDEHSFRLPAGSIVVADYRTVHRGGAHESISRQERTVLANCKGARRIAGVIVQPKHPGIAQAGHHPTPPPEPKNAKNKNDLHKIKRKRENILC